MDQDWITLQGQRDPTRLLAVRLLHRLFIPWITVENEHRFPVDDKPHIFAFNHNSSFETLPLALYLAFKRKGRGLAFVSDWMYGRLPLIGWLFRQVDPVYVGNKRARYGFINRDRHKAPISANPYAECIERLRNKQSLGIFPEGKRNRNPGVLLRGRKGIGEIVLRSGVSVQPIGIDFPARMKEGRIPVFGAMVLRVGPSLTFSREISAARELSADCASPEYSRGRLWIYLRSRVTHSVMSALAELCGKQYPYPPPVTLPEATALW